MSTYLALTFDVPAALAEDASMLLHDEEASGVEIRDHEILPPPGMAPPPPGRAVVVGYFDGDAEGEEIAARVRSDLEASAPGEEIRSGLARLADEAWAETWKLHFKPVSIRDALWVVPPWETPPAGVPSVVIEPGMAFGTGGHATTVLCLEGLVDTLSRRKAATVLDVGCGSGILAIAACKLGASELVMIDNDPLAVKIAAENAELNGCARIRTSEDPVQAVAGEFDVVVANILANTLIELADPIAAKVAAGGELFLAGVLATQVDEVEAAYRARGLVMRERRQSGEWTLSHLERPR